MTRFLNLLALIALIAGATWAYSVKYETILVAEKLKKRESELQRERDAIAILQVEWQLLNRPGRLHTLAKPEPGMQVISALQMTKAGDIPRPPPGGGDKIDALLTGSIGLPEAAKKPARPAGTAKSTALAAPSIRTGSAPRVLARSQAPLKLVPPAKIGATPKLQASAPTAAPEPAGGVTGFLKKLFR